MLLAWSWEPELPDLGARVDLGRDEASMAVESNYRVSWLQRFCLAAVLIAKSGSEKLFERSRIPVCWVVAKLGYTKSA